MGFFDSVGKFLKSTVSAQIKTIGIVVPAIEDGVDVIKGKDPKHTLEAADKIADDMKDATDAIKGK